ncbi:MAG TPA: hypothetical protein VFW09_04370 [Solirubrobacteraceae bacterium]|nr:hypothetical protein [Solirubrobacteraceae bacterium]
MDIVNVATNPHRDTDTDTRELYRQVERLRAENGRLRSRNRDLRVAVDAYVRRVNRAGLFGPLEMTAGTCVGPRHRRGGRRMRLRAAGRATAGAPRTPR